MPNDGPGYSSWWGRLPVLILIAVLFGLGAYRIAVADNDMDGFAMVTVAILLVGVWTTVELHDRFYGEHKQHVQSIREEIIKEEES